MPNKREVEIIIKNHGSNWVNHERPVWCPECESKNIKHSISISRSGDTKNYTAECMCLDCGCEFNLVRMEVDNGK